MRKIVAVCMTSMILCLSACSSGSQPTEQTESFFAMDTYINFTAYGENAQEALAEARDKIEDLEVLWSVTDMNSDIYAVNHSGGQPVTVSDYTARLLSFALDMADSTDGALEPTIYPVLTAWGFTTDKNRIPSEEEIRLLQHESQCGGT